MDHKIGGNLSFFGITILVLSMKTEELLSIERIFSCRGNDVKGSFFCLEKILFCFVSAFFLLSPAFVFADPSSIAVTVGTSLEAAARQAISPEKAVKEEKFVELQLGSLELQGLGGQSLEAKGYKQKKVVLYFWSVYCHACVDTMQELQQIRDDLSKKDVELLTVHLFEPDSEKIAQTVRNLGITLPIVLAPKAIRDLFSVKVLPTSLIFDADHKLVARFEGDLDREGLRLSLFGKVSQPATPVK